MLPSASLGARDAKTGKQRALYEPIHGSAPDIAGQDKANPIAAILSFAMCLRYSFAMKREADLIEKVVAAVLDDGYRTADIMQPGMRQVGTKDMGSAMIAQIERVALSNS
jgi:3-isopropylmalate dehydrogenase